MGDDDDVVVVVCIFAFDLELFLELANPNELNMDPIPKLLFLVRADEYERELVDVLLLEQDCVLYLLLGAISVAGINLCCIVLYYI